MLADKLSVHIQSVRLYRERLATLQAVWDNLSLLSQMSGDSTDMHATRTAFEQLSVTLLQRLAAESLNKTLQSMHGRAQVAIDVLVRNLFERTADIGFICADQEVQQFLLQPQPASDEQQRLLRKRFAEYVAKYSVYEDVALLAPDGTVLLQLSGEPMVARSTDPLVKAAVTSNAAYVECFRRIDVFGGQTASLVYAYRVAAANRTLGIVCLKFRLQDEVQGIFRKLLNAQDWLVLTFVDADGVVLASSDVWQIPVGAQFPVVKTEGAVVRFAGREYLAVTHAAKAFQGYAGPGWTCHALIPVEQVCNAETSAAALTLPPQTLAAVRRNALVFAAQLQKIPQQAEGIQRELNRAVWNGHIHIGTRAGINHAFSKVLLREISHTGRKTQEVFEQSVSELERTVVSAILYSSRTAAALAVDILDRNLYERANDCRWWALDRRLVNHLGSADGGVTTKSAEVTQVLRRINELYTVYHTLVLFDVHCKVVAVSNEQGDALLGTVLPEAWAQATLSLPNSQSYHVSAFEPSQFYTQQNTWVYTAALRSTVGRVVGGIGIVFDATPQLRAMLDDALMNMHPGSLAVFVSRNGRVLAATARYQPGDVLNVDRELLAPPPEGDTRIIALDGTYYAIGVQAGAGYREYPGIQVLAMVMVPLGEVTDTHLPARIASAEQMTARRSTTDTEYLELATFYVGMHWLSVPSACVLEAMNADKLHTLPEKVRGRAGYVMFDGQAVMVVDLAMLLDGASRASRSGEVVLVRAADGKLLGLLVDSLGEIPQVSVAAVLPMSDLRAITDRMVRGEQADAPLLMIVSVERVVAAMNGG